jgi:hypothetical protein
MFEQWVIIDTHKAEKMPIAASDFVFAINKAAGRVLPASSTSDDELAWDASFFVTVFYRNMEKPYVRYKSLVEAKKAVLALGDNIKNVEEVAVIGGLRVVHHIFN